MGEFLLFVDLHQPGVESGEYKLKIEIIFTHFQIKFNTFLMRKLTSPERNLSSAIN